MSEVLYYKIRRVKGGPLVPCKIWFGPPSDPVTGEPLDRAPRWHCEVSGKLLDDPFQVIMVVGNTATVKGEPSDEEEYRWMTRDAEWCRDYEPEAPEANPNAPIDVNKMPPIKFK